jgi:hypothetical protein
LIHFTNKTKDDIIKLVEHYYNNKEKTELWYRKPNIYFQKYNKDKISPSQMVEEGRGDEVLNWLKLLLGD